MKPYYEDDAVTIYHGDCRDVLPFGGGKDDAIDLVLTDPPYNISFGGYGKYRDKMLEQDYIDLLARLRIYRRIVISQYPEETMRLVVPALGPPDHVGAWCYNSNLARRFRLINYYGLRPDYSRIKQPYKNPNDKRIIALIAAGSKGTNLYEWWADIQLVKNVSVEKTIHPCPLPEQLVSRILALVIEPGWLVLDPFMGIGTTLRAAKGLGCKAIGIEIDERYCEVAANRMIIPSPPVQSAISAERKDRFKNLRS